MLDKLTLKYLIGGVLAIWLVAFALMLLFLPDWQTRGQFGDLFGAVNALFSGLAFAGLFSALQIQQRQLDLQRTELQLQRDELKLQRDEMVASRGELANQVRVQKAQFEASVAQILVASTQARIEAIKMASEQVSPGGRQAYVLQIESLATALDELSNRVEERCKDAA